MNPLVCDNCGVPWYSNDGVCHLCRKGGPQRKGEPVIPRNDNTSLGCGIFLLLAVLAFMGLVVWWNR